MNDIKFLEFWTEIINPYIKHSLGGDGLVYTLYDIDPLVATHDKYKDFRAQKEVEAQKVYASLKGTKI